MIVAIGLGSNLGDRVDNLHQAIEQIGERIGLVKAQSSFLKTVPEGFVSDNDFVNAVVVIETSLAPLVLLEELKRIEVAMGRIGRGSRGQEYADRTIDLDILFIERLVVCEEQLIVPHPELHKRLFVLLPLAEVMPDWRHPLLGATVRELLSGVDVWGK